MDNTPSVGRFSEQGDGLHVAKEAQAPGPVV